MVQASELWPDPRAMAAAAVRHPDNAPAIAALTDLLWVMHRSRMMLQQGTPVMALVVHLVRCGPMRPSDLAGAMHLDQSTVSRHLTHLESSGLVARTPDPADGRAHVVAATAAGRAQAGQMVAARVHDFEQVIDGWSDLDRSDFSRLLTRFSDEFAARLGEDVAVHQHASTPPTAAKDTG
jgi:DNA-binding MarR family transcriptional regulator